MINDDGGYAVRSNDPIRVFLNSESASVLDNRYTFYLNIDAENDTYDIYFQLRKVQITYSWYNITSSNGSITLSREGEEYYYSLEPGNYRIDEIVTLLNDHYSVSSRNITFYYDENANKITVSSTEAFAWGESTLHSILGFSSVPSSSSTSFTGDQLVDVTPIKTINFHLVNTPNRSFAIYPGMDKTRLVCSLFVGNSEPYSSLQSTDDTYFRESTLLNNLRSFEFLLTDQNGNKIDLQNGAFQMIVEFTFRPKKVWKLFSV